LALDRFVLRGGMPHLLGGLTIRSLPRSVQA
jgi:hypothetical protein